MDYGVSIALRVSPTLNSKHIHFKTKYELVKACFKSLVRALEGLDFELFVILDGCPKHFEKIFRENVEEHNLKIVNVGGVGNSATFLLQTLILSDLSSSDYVYFAEDDYFYIGSVREMLELASKKPFVDFVSPYDHPDYYFRRDLHPYKFVYLKYGNRLWKNVMSTCCTFLTKKSTLMEVRELLQSYKKVSDYYMWYLLTRKVPLKNMIRVSPRPRYLRRLAYLLRYMQKYSSRRAYSLWVPEPTIATHMQEGCLSPKVDWSKHFNRIDENIFR